MKIFARLACFFIILILFTGCSSKKTIVNNLQERDANEIIVFLNSKNIDATKVQSSQGQASGAQKEIKWDIVVPADKSIEAMNYLDHEGLPRQQNQSLLQIFNNNGLVPSETQQKIRYQAGLAQQIANTIEEIDGVLDANVIISFPNADPLTGKTTRPITASVYVKHNGVLDDPNTHLKSRIQRLVAASVSGLNYDNVTVIGDRAQLVDDSNLKQDMNEEPELIKIWSIELSKKSSFYFRLLFASLLISNVIFLALLSLFSWRIYPLLKESHWSLFSLKQIKLNKEETLNEPIKNQESTEESKVINKEIDSEDI